MSESESFADIHEEAARLLDEYATLLEMGKAPPKDDWLAKYPELEFLLRPGLEQIEKLGEFVQHAESRAASAGSIPTLPMMLDDYELIQCLGRGGMSDVYLARQKSLHRLVAVKILPPGFARDPNRRFRFLTEANATANLKHPNIVAVYSQGEQNGCLYFAMQYIEGETVAQWMARLREQLYGDTPSDEAKMPVLGGDSAEPSVPLHELLPHAKLEPHSVAYYRDVAELGIDTARTLAFAHKQGLIHRDIKPSNIMRDVRGHLWITDFGLAYVPGRNLTDTGAHLGTFRYMSPEQWTGTSPMSVGSDIFSLGVTLFELLTLPPRNHESVGAVWMQEVMQGNPPSAKATESRVPRGVDAIVRKAMAKNPHDRYDSMDALADDLARFLNGQVTLAQKEQSWWWGSGRGRRYSSLIVTAILGFLVVGILVVGILALVPFTLVSRSGKVLLDPRDVPGPPANLPDVAKLGMTDAQLLPVPVEGPIRFAFGTYQGVPGRLVQFQQEGNQYQLQSSLDLQAISPGRASAVSALLSATGQWAALTDARGETFLFRTNPPQFEWQLQVNRGESVSTDAGVPLVFSERGRYLVTRKDDGVHVFRTQDATLVHTFDPAVQSVAFRADERRLAVAMSGRVELWKTDSWEPEGLPLPHAEPVDRIVAIRDLGVATFDRRGVIRIWKGFDHSLAYEFKPEEPHAPRTLADLERLLGIVDLPSVPSDSLIRSLGLGRSPAGWSLDKSFGQAGVWQGSLAPRGDNPVRLVVRQDGTICVACGYESYDSGPGADSEEISIVTFDTHGRPFDWWFDPQRRPAAPAGPCELALQTDDKVVLFGSRFPDARSPTQFAMMRWTSAGRVDVNVNPIHALASRIEQRSVCWCGGMKEGGLGGTRKFILGGGITRDQEHYQPVLACCLDDGTGDPNFGEEGVVHLPQFDARIHAVAMTSDERIVATGNFGEDKLLLALFQPDGKIVYFEDPDPSEKVVWRAGYSIHVMPREEYVIVAGTAPYRHPIQSPAAIGLARFRISDGALDTSFGQDGIARVPFESSVDTAHCAAVDREGNLYMIGYGHDTKVNSAVMVMAIVASDGKKVLFQTQGSSNTRGRDIKFDAEGRMLLLGSVVSSLHNDTFLLRFVRDK